MGKPIGYNPARLQRAYLPVPGIELMKKGNPDCRLNTTDRQPTTGNRQPGTDNR